MTNPSIKKGHEVLIMEANNGQPKELEGQVFIVNSNTANYINIRTKSNASYNFYYGNGGYKKDRWCQPNKESKIKYYENLIIENDKEKERLLADNEEINRKLDILRNYESEDEYLLEKLDIVLNSPGTTKKKARLEALKIIREGKI